MEYHAKVKMVSRPPRDPSLYEYEPIEQFFLDKNYILNNNNNNNTPIRPPARIRRINMLIAKRNINISLKHLNMNMLNRLWLLSPMKYLPFKI